MSDRPVAFDPKGSADSGQPRLGAPRGQAGKTGSLQVGIGVLAVLYAAVSASRIGWVCDDAFISFRYAKNLADGLGLVFNPGERVEGYSNFLWTLWIALGMKLGVDPETWSVAWGVAFFAGTVLLLFLRTAREFRGAAMAGWPIAAVFAAAHSDWQAFATSGLETSFFTFHAVLIYTLLTGGKASLPRSAWAGAASAMIAMNRPDGVLFAGIGALFVLAFRRPRLPFALAFASGLLLLWVPYTAWRLWYFGDFFSNPYYAKSAYLPWYSQGWTYLLLYFQKYWVALLGLPLAVIGMLVSRWRGARPADASAERRRMEDTLLAVTFAAGYAAFVLRVGGDFMFARFLIPATPFLFILLELGLERITASQRFIGALAPAACLIAMIATPHPLPDSYSRVDGIVNERAWYPAGLCDDRRRRGVMLATKYFHDLPVRLAFMGGEARLAFYAQPMIAIESETGLTDRFIARQPLTRRGRVGHEKIAPLDYLTQQRGAHLIFHGGAPLLLDLSGRLPYARIRFDDTRALLLTWDPALMTALRARGAVFRDFPAQLDTVIAGLDTLSNAQAQGLYSAVRRFYFAHVDDPARESRFRRRLGLAPVAEDSSAAAVGSDRGDGRTRTAGP